MPLIALVRGGDQFNRKKKTLTGVLKTSLCEHLVRFSRQWPWQSPFLVTI